MLPTIVFDLSTTNNMKQFKLYYRLGLSNICIIAIDAKDLMHCLETYGDEGLRIIPIK